MKDEEATTASKSEKVKLAQEAPCFPQWASCNGKVKAWSL